MSFVAGIDPGLTGAVAVVWEREDTLHLRVWDMPVMDKHVDAMRIVELLDGARIVAIERQQVIARDGRSQGAVSAFRTGLNYGLILGGLHVARIPHFVVTPSVWKRRMGVPADKDAVRLAAMRRFPGYEDLFRRKKDHGRAEAALLALFAKGG